MQFKTLIFAAVASVAVAQTATSAASTSASTCLAQNILDACMATIKGQVNSCGYSDYSCLCTQYQNMLTCYNNCPNDPGVGTYQALREQNCNFASVYGTTTTAVSAPASSGSSTATSTGSGSGSSASSAASGFATGTTSTRTGSGSSTQTSSSSESSSSSSAANGAEGLAIGVFALAAAGVAALL